MKQYLCPICQSPIVCTYYIPDIYYYQDENDDIVRDLNAFYDDCPRYHFHCSNDKADNINALNNLSDFIKWKNNYTEFIEKDIQKEGV